MLKKHVVLMAFVSMLKGLFVVRTSGGRTNTHTANASATCHHNSTDKAITFVRQKLQHGSLNNTLCWSTINSACSPGYSSRILVIRDSQITEYSTNSILAIRDSQITEYNTNSILVIRDSQITEYSTNSETNWLLLS